VDEVNVVGCAGTVPVALDWELHLAEQPGALSTNQPTNRVTQTNPCIPPWPPTTNRSGMLPHYRVTSPVSGTSYSVLMRRALTARQAALLLRGRRQRGWAAFAGSGSVDGGADDSDSDAEEVRIEASAQRLGSIGPSHPISATPSSGRHSDTGAGSDAGSSVLGGVPPLPPRASGAASFKAQREAQAALRLLRELLKRDYAVGYLFLSWLLRTSWTLVPAVAALLGMPNPTEKGGCISGCFVCVCGGGGCLRCHTP